MATRTSLIASVVLTFLVTWAGLGGPATGHAQPHCDNSSKPACDGWCDAAGQACADLGGGCVCTTGFPDCGLGSAPDCYGICGGEFACVDTGGGCACMALTTTTGLPGTVTLPSTTTTSSTTTSTTTTIPPVGGIDHFQCYKAKDLRNPRFEQVEDVSLVDQFGSSTADVKKPFLVCAPVDKNGSGTTNPATHQCCYKIKGTKLDPAVDVEIGDQFGDLQLQLKKAQLLCQPCSKALLP